MLTIFAHETGVEHDEPTSILVPIGITLLVIAGVVLLRWYNSRKG